MLYDSKCNCVQFKEIESATLCTDAGILFSNGLTWKEPNDFPFGFCEQLAGVGFCFLELRCVRTKDLEILADYFRSVSHPRVIFAILLSQLEKQGCLPQLGSCHIKVELEPGDLVHGVRALTSRLKSVYAANAMQSSHFLSVELPIDAYSQKDAVQFAMYLFTHIRNPIVIKPLVDPLANGLSENAMTWKELDNLYGLLQAEILSINVPNAVMFFPGFIPTRILTEHPCNAYVSHGKKCHSGKSELPRRLWLLENGSFIPLDKNMSEKLQFGDINETKVSSIFSTYLSSESHKLFKDAAKIAFTQWIQPTIFRIVPQVQLLNDCVLEMLQNELSNSDRYYEP